MPLRTSFQSPGAHGIASRSSRPSAARKALVGIARHRLAPAMHVIIDAISTCVPALDKTTFFRPEVLSASHPGSPRRCIKTTRF
jgi:hypothetical protein